MNTWLIILILYILSGVVNSIMDTIRDHYYTSIFSSLGDFWNPLRSWKFKWKNGDPAQGERFPLSSTIFVFLTDGWHLMKWVMFTLIEVSICLGRMEWYWIPAGVIALKCLRGASFSLFYQQILVKK